MKRDEAEGRLLRDYLLGRANEAEAAALEDRYFVDDDVFARLEDAADDLASAYVRGQLSPDDRGRFERHCMGSEDDRLRLRIAQALERERHRERAGARTAPARRSLLDRIASYLTPGGSTGRLVLLAATLAMVVGSTWLSLRVSDLRTQIKRVESDVANQRGATDAAAASARAAQTERDRLAQQLATLLTPRFDLMSGVDRAAGGTDLVVPADAAAVRFDLALDRPASADRFRATLRTIDRVRLWSAEVPGQTGSRTVTVQVPAVSLPSGACEIVLEVLGPTGQPSEIGTYPFSVRRR